VDYAYGRLGSTGDAKSVHEEVAKQQFDSFGSMLTGKKLRWLRKQARAITGLWFQSMILMAHRRCIHP